MTGCTCTQIKPRRPGQQQHSPQSTAFDAEKHKLLVSLSAAAGDLERIQKEDQLYRQLYMHGDPHKQKQTSRKMLAGVRTGFVTPRPRPCSEDDEGWYSAPEEEWQLTEQDTDAASQALNRWRLTPPAVAALLASENSRADGKAEEPATSAATGPVSKHAVRPRMRTYAGVLVTGTPPHKILQVPFNGVLVRSGVEA